MTRKVRPAPLAVCALLALVAPALPALAQETAEPEAAQQEPVPELKLADILRGAADDQARIRQLQKGAEPATAIVALAEGLPALEEDIASRIPAADSQIQEFNRVRTLQELEERWLREQGKLESSRAQVSSRALALQGSLEELLEVRKRWRAAREEARSLEVPKGLIAQIDETLALIAAARSSVEQRWAQVLEIEARLGAQISKTIEVTARAKSAREAARQDLLQSENLPIWTALLEFGELTAISRRGEDELAADFAAAREYAYLQRTTLALQALLTLGLLAGFLALQRTALRITAEEPEASAMSSLFRRPYSAGVLLGAQLVLLTHTSAPEGFRAATGAIVIVPFIRLVPILFPRAQTAVFGLLGFYLIDRARMVMVGLPLVERVTFEAQMLLAIGATLWLLRSGRLHDALGRGGTLEAAVGMMLRLWLGLLAFAVGASVIGYDDLGHVIGEAVLRTTYDAVMYTALYRILVGLIPVALRTRAAQHANVVRRHRPLLTRRLIGALGLAAAALWLWEGLNYFTIREGLVERVQGALATGITVGTLSIDLGDMVALVAAIVASVYVSRFVRFVLEEEALPRMNLARGVPHAVSVTAGYVVLSLGLVVALAAGGIDLGRISLVAGAFSVGIGFGLQNVVNNFVSGLILIFERPIQLQDTIQVGELLGVVQRIGIRSSTVRTFQGAEVIVPNALLISDQVVNWTMSDRRRRIEIPIGVSYDADPEKVIQVLQEVARHESRLLEDPEPEVVFTSFGDSAINFEMRVWIGSGDWILIRSDLGVAVRRALKDAGIPIAYPQRDLHLRTAPATGSEQESA